MMKKNIHFVTAIFNWLHNHPDFNGRLNRDRWYAESLNVLHSMDATFDLYGTARDFKTLRNFHLPSVTKIETSLYELPFHTDIQRIIALNSGGPIQRSHHVMYGKIEWLRESCKGCDDDDYIFWIDAGLSNRGVFPDRCSSNGKVPSADLDVFYNLDKMFTTKLRDAIVDKAGEKILFIESNQPEGIQGVNKKIFGLEGATLAHPGNIVGGLFGGKVRMVNKLIALFDTLREKMFEMGQLYNEELLLTIIANTLVDEVEVMNFITWYHEDTIHAPNTTLKSFCDVFTEDLGIEF